LSGRRAPDMRVVNAVPSSTPDSGAAWPEFKDVKVTTVVEDTSEADAEVTCSRLFGKSQIRRPPDLGERYTILTNGPWKLVCATANSKSYQIISDLGLTIAGESNDGQSYELVVGGLCFFVLVRELSVILSRVHLITSLLIFIELSMRFYVTALANRHVKLC